MLQRVSTTVNYVYSLYPNVAYIFTTLHVKIYDIDVMYNNII